jgi:hypothetical protein
MDGGLGYPEYRIDILGTIPVRLIWRELAFGGNPSVGDPIVQLFFQDRTVDLALGGF